MGGGKPAAEAETRAFRVQTLKLPLEEEEPEPGTDDAATGEAATAKADEAEARTAATVDADNAADDEHEEPAERQTRGVERSRPSSLSRTSARLYNCCARAREA